MPQRLVVSNNNNDGSGSLREALRASQRGTGSFEIVFRGNNDANTNNLGLSEFTIALQDPLPIIHRNTVHINTIDPRNVNLIPEPSARSANAGPGPMQHGRGFNGSLLYVGDTNILNSWRGQSYARKSPNVVLNNINFLSNVARGENGQDPGGGGGLGSGGGISLIRGHLTVENSQFQGLNAIGGSGSPSRAMHGQPRRADANPKNIHNKPRGGHRRRHRTLIFYEARAGRSGGDGGISSIPFRRGLQGDPRFGINARVNLSDVDNRIVASANGRHLKAVNGRGGVGGRGGWDLWYFRHQSGMTSQNWPQAHHMAGVRPLFGENGQSPGIFGFGGGGGGGGGHPGNPANHHWDPRTRAQIGRFHSGSGGIGGRGGELAGSGASGKTAPASNREGFGGPGALPYPSNGQLLPGSLGPRTRAEHTYEWRRGANRGWVRGPRRTLPVPPGDQRAQDGQSLGAAIALLGGHARRNARNYRELPNVMATLDLNNVNFVNIGTNARVIDGDTGPGGHSRVRMNNVKIGANINSLQPFDPGNRTQGPTGGMETLIPDVINTSPTYRAVSTPRLSNVLDTLNPELRGKHGTAELFYIGFEQASSFAGLVTDISDPDNVFNQLWRDVVPNNEDEIIARFQAETNATFTDFAGDAVRSIPISVTKNLMGRATSAAIAAIPFPLSLGIELIHAGGHLISNVQRDEATARATRSAINRRREQALAENQERQERLFEQLKSHRNESIGSVNLTQGRSVVHIHDFTLGEDTIILPEMDGDIAPSFVGAAVGGNIAPAIEFRNSNQTNAANHFLTVHLSDESLSEFRRINNQEISSIINLLQIDENDNRIIGTRGARPNFIDNPNYRGGIGRNVHIVDRNLVSFSDEVTFNILTSVSSDTIYGSRGAEVIRSNQGDDIVFPTAGRTSEIKVQKDEVFGGLGDDIVSYAADLVELDLRSFSSDGNSSGVRVFDQGVEIGVLKGFESFHTYGASNVDLSELGPVDPNFSTNYTIVTGSGGTIKGSTDDDVVMLSFNESYNTDVASAYNEKVSVIEGNSGFDRLYLDFSNSSGEFKVSRLEGPSNFVVSHEGHILVRATDVEAVDIQAKNQSYNFQISQLAKDFSSQEDDFLFLEGGLSDDVIYGGAYNEKISSYSGNDIIVAGSGDDDLNGGEGNNTYSPGSGNDKVNLSGGSDLIILEEGDDVIVNFDITDRLVFKKIKEVKLKKLGKENYDTNVIVGHNELQYKNDFTSEFNTVEFKDLGFASALWKAVDSSLIPLLDSAYASAIYNSI